MDNNRDHMENLKRHLSVDKLDGSGSKKKLTMSLLF